MSTLFIISTSLGAFAYCIPVIIRYIVGWFFSESREERNIRREIFRLEQEMSNISMVDEFSRYTKIQRRHTKLREDHKNRVSERISARAKGQLFFTYGAKIFNAIVMLIMMNMYRNEPVIILPKGLLWPLDSVLSWPSDYEDSISFAMWIGMITIVTSSKV